MDLLGSLESISLKSHFLGVISMPVPKSLNDNGSFLVHIDVGVPEGESMSKSPESIESGEGEPSI